ARHSAYGRRIQGDRNSLQPMRVIEDEMEVKKRSELVSEMTVDRIQFKPNGYIRKGGGCPSRNRVSFSEEDIKNIVLLRRVLGRRHLRPFSCSGQHFPKSSAHNDLLPGL